MISGRREAPQKKAPVFICSSVELDYTRFLRKVIEHAGYRVEPINLIEEIIYRKLSKSSGFRKMWLRLSMYFHYPIYIAYKAITAPNGSLFIVSSNTFYAPVVVSLFSKIKNTKVVHLLYDLYPDAIEVAGVIKNDGFLSYIIGLIAKHNQQKLDGTVYLGDILRTHAEYRWGTPPIGEKIDISADLSVYSDIRPVTAKSDEIILHYGGQLGHLHDADILIKSTKRILSKYSDHTQFIYYLSGAQAKYLGNELRGLQKTQIIEAIPSAQWREDIKSFHIGIVTLTPGGATVCLPSKTYGMMAGGLAIIAICPIWSDLAQLVLNLEAGWVINNSPYTTIDETKGPNYLDKICKRRDAEDIVNDFDNIIISIIKNRDIMEEKRRNAFLGVRRFYGIDTLSRKWSDFISKI